MFLSKARSNYKTQESEFLVETAKLDGVEADFDLDLVNSGGQLFNRGNLHGQLVLALEKGRSPDGSVLQVDELGRNLALLQVVPPVNRQELARLLEESRELSDFGLQLLLNVLLLFLNFRFAFAVLELIDWGFRSFQQLLPLEYSKGTCSSVILGSSRL